MCTSPATLPVMLLPMKIRLDDLPVTGLFQKEGPGFYIENHSISVYHHGCSTMLNRKKNFKISSNWGLTIWLLRAIISERSGERGKNERRTDEVWKEMKEFQRNLKKVLDKWRKR